MNTIKLVLSSVLLLAVFSLPTLTATQLVGVLGESTEASPFKIDPVSSGATFTKLVGNQLTISYLKGGTYPVLKITNPNPVSRVIRVVVGPATDANVTNQLVSLSLGTVTDRLYDHSLSPFNRSYDLTIGARQVVPVSLNVTAPDASSHGTIKLILEQF